MGAKQRIYTAGVLYYTVLKVRTDFRKGRQEDVMERNDPRYQAYVEILKEELIPAMGCTEPIALAYAAAKAREVLGVLPDSVQLQVSGSIIKNVKSVIVPNTGHLKGMEAAVAAGIIAGSARRSWRSSRRSARKRSLPSGTICRQCPSPSSTPSRGMCLTSSSLSAAGRTTPGCASRTTTPTSAALRRTARCCTRCPCWTRPCRRMPALTAAC